MSSATFNLFASLAIATAGAAGLAYTLSHPGVLTAAAGRILSDTGFKPSQLRAKTELSANDGSHIIAASLNAGEVTIPAGDYGHFNTVAEINGRTIDVMVDTGASLVALTYEDADAIGVYVRPSDFTHTAQTANGVARVAPVTIPKISIGDITVRNVQGVVSERGKSERTLLGMSFLGRLSRVEMRGGTLVLQE